MARGGATPFYEHQEDEVVMAVGQPPTTVSPVELAEVPPPYTKSSSDASGVPMVTCRVCQGMIDISSKREQHVVKCIECSEDTVSYLSNSPFRS